jgi:signal peptidase II
VLFYVITKFSSLILKKYMMKILWFSLSFCVIILDQITKLWINNHFQLYDSQAIFPSLNLTLLYNPGVAFSFLADAGGWQRWFFTGLSSIISIFLITWIIRLDARQRWLSCAIALILGGAIGNLIDRVVYGYVIDFIDVYYRHWHWPAFNVADSAISVGAVMLFIDLFWENQKTT